MIFIRLMYYFFEYHIQLIEIGSFHVVYYYLKQTILSKLKKTKSDTTCFKFIKVLCNTQVLMFS